MPLYLESQKVPLPATPECAALSGEARKILTGPGSWLALQEKMALALQSFRAATGADAAVWVADAAWIDAENIKSSLVTLYFGTDGKPTRAQLSAFESPFAGDPAWSPDGVHDRPDDAFPSLALRAGELYQVWIEDQGEPAAIALTGFGARVSRARRPFARASERDFLAVAKHAVGRVPAPDIEKDRHRRQLKAAFALSVAKRIVDADGVLDAGETLFLERLVPREELAELWLDDPHMLEALARQAPQELPALLGHHEKLALLSTFYAACYADGKVEVRELKVLKEAAAALGLEATEVIAQLKKLM